METKVPIAKAGDMNALGEYIPAEGLRNAAKNFPNLIFDEETQTLYATGSFKVNIGG